VPRGKEVHLVHSPKNEFPRFEIVKEAVANYHGAAQQNQCTDGVKENGPTGLVELGFKARWGRIQELRAVFRDLDLVLGIIIAPRRARRATRIVYEARTADCCPE